MLPWEHLKFELADHFLNFRELLNYRRKTTSSIFSPTCPRHLALLVRANDVFASLFYVIPKDSWVLFNRLLYGAAHTCVHIYFHCCFILCIFLWKKKPFFGHPRSLLTATSFCIAATTFVLSALVHLSTQLVPLFLTVFVAPLFSSIFSVTNEMPVQKKDVMMNEGGDDGAIMGACPMWNLPDEILLSMLAFLPIEDLCNVIRVRLSYQVRIYMGGKRYNPNNIFWISLEGTLCKYIYAVYRQHHQPRTCWRARRHRWFPLYKWSGVQVWWFCIYH